VASDVQIDFLIVHLTVDWRMRTPEDRKNLRDLTEVLIRNKENSGKHLQSWEVVLEEEKPYLDAGIPVYLTLEDASNAISKLIQHHEFRGKVN
jgi:acyl-CoA synthetase (NDP forming)